MSSASQPEDRRSTGSQMQNEPPAWISNLGKNERADAPDRRKSSGQPENAAEANTTRNVENASGATPNRQSDVGNVPSVPAKPAKNVRADNMHASASTWPDPVTHVSMSDSAPSARNDGGAVQQDFPSALPATPRPKTPPTLHVKVWNEDNEDVEAAGVDEPRSADHAATEPVSRSDTDAESTQSDIEDMPTSVLSFGSDARDAINAAVTRPSVSQPDRADRSARKAHDSFEDEHDPEIEHLDTVSLAVQKSADTPYAEIEHLDTVSLAVQKSADTPLAITERPEFNVVRENTPAPGGEATQIVEDQARRSSSGPSSSPGRSPSQPGWLPPSPTAGPTSSPGRVAADWSSLPPVPTPGPTSSPGQVASNWSQSSGPTSSPGRVAADWSSSPTQSSGPTSSPGQVASNWSSLPPVPEPSWSPTAGPTSSPGQVASSWPSSPPTPPAGPVSSPGRSASLAGIASGPEQGERNYAANAPSYAPNTPSFPAAAPVATPAVSRRKNRAPLIVALVVVVLLLVGAAGAWIALSHPFAINPVTEPTQSFQNASLGVTLLYPTKWSAHVESGKAHVHFSDSTNTDQFDITSASANGTDPGQYLQNQVKQLGITAAKSGAPVSFAGTSWQQIKGNLQVNGANYTEAIYAAIHSGHLYTITDMAPQSTFADENTLVFSPTNTSLQFN